jgi:threonine/homoserine/homoserine lactone efflux protein
MTLDSLPLDPTLFQLYLAAAVVLVLLPGPDTLLVVLRSARGRTVGLIATAGITVGNVVHATVAATGVAAVVAASPVLFDALRWLGAGYLVWIGLAGLASAWRGWHSDATAPEAALRPVASREVLIGALATNLLNAKVILFHVSFVPQFVDPSRGAVGVQTFLLGLVLAAMGAVYLGLLAILGSAVARRAYASAPIRAALDGIAGVLFLAFALRLLTTERRTV